MNPQAQSPEDEVRVTCSLVYPSDDPDTPTLRFQSEYRPLNESEYRPLNESESRPLVHPGVDMFKEGSTENDKPFEGAYSQLLHVRGDMATKRFVDRAKKTGASLNNSAEQIAALVDLQEGTAQTRHSSSAATTGPLETEQAELQRLSTTLENLRSMFPETVERCFEQVLEAQDASCRKAWQDTDGRLRTNLESQKLGGHNIDEELIGHWSLAGKASCDLHMSRHLLENTVLAESYRPSTSQNPQRIEAMREDCKAKKRSAHDLQSIFNNGYRSQYGTNAPPITTEPGWQDLWGLERNKRGEVRCGWTLVHPGGDEQELTYRLKPEYQVGDQGWQSVKFSDGSLLSAAEAQSDDVPYTHPVVDFSRVYPEGKLGLPSTSLGTNVIDLLETLVAEGRKAQSDSRQLRGSELVGDDRLNDRRIGWRRVSAAVDKAFSQLVEKASTDLERLEEEQSAAVKAALDRIMVESGASNHPDKRKFVEPWIEGIKSTNEAEAYESGTLRHILSKVDQDSDDGSDDGGDSDGDSQGSGDGTEKSKVAEDPVEAALKLKATNRRVDYLELHQKTFGDRPIPSNATEWKKLFSSSSPNWQTLVSFGSTEPKAEVESASASEASVDTARTLSDLSSPRRRTTQKPSSLHFGEF